MSNGQPDLLKDLSTEETAGLLALGTRISLQSGGELFRLGSEASSLYLIERGRIALTLPMQVLGRGEDILVEERLPGQTVGWSALIPPHKFTLKATAPLETEVLALSRMALLEHFSARPGVGYLVTRNLASVIGHRLQVFQAMWLREMQRVVELRGR
ncbi:MAG TPA: cyclic nucleotide-binding domain-containing protein [Vicinamibacteria bacterium]|nr:cyclic nucleotide-binding domain-containing protein [Vicinamibacteria bacterium]